MATVFMKWLETKPADYDRGIRLLTLGRIETLKDTIVDQFVRKGSCVLEIGCGTGVLAVKMAKCGAQVTAVDASPAMLEVLQRQIAETGLNTCIQAEQIEASQVGNRFAGQQFDLIVSTLLFSELPIDVQDDVLTACRGLLTPGGRMLVADEVIPAAVSARLLYKLIRFPLAVLTWLLTRTSTSALEGFETRLADNGYAVINKKPYLGGSLVLYENVVVGEPHTPVERQPRVAGQLVYRVTLRTRLIDLWALFFRLMPPYPKVRPGLYRVGDPNRASPVLVTGNFDVTVRRLVQAIDGRLDSWLLVVNTSGINIWCAAGGGFLSAA